MTVEEIKNKLMSAEEEGVDRVSVYDEVLSAVSAREEEVAASMKESEDKIAEMTDKIANLTETNLKLLEKIKYVEDVAEEAEESDDAEEITIADLFVEEEE